MFTFNQVFTAMINAGSRCMKFKRNKNGLYYDIYFIINGDFIRFDRIMILSLQHKNGV